MMKIIKKREMLIETMSKFSYREYDTVTNGRKEPVDNTLNDTFSSSDEQNNEKVSKMNENENSPSTQSLIVTTNSINIPDIPPLVITSPYIINQVIRSK